MTKIRPCQKSLPDGSTCPYPAAKGLRQCRWHWLAKQPADVQQRAAAQRLTERGDREHRARVPSSEWPDGERWCSVCQSFVPLFYCSGSRCKSCASSAAHGSRIEKTYGITPERYAELLRQQGGRCAICTNRPRTQRLAVDHDHQTGEPRGLLCKRCNHDLLGGGHDDLEILWRAIEYLLFPPAKYPQRDQILRSHIMDALDERLRLRVLLATPPPVDPQTPPF